MTSTQTTTTTKKTNRYFRALAALAMMAVLLAVAVSRIAHATTTFTVNFNGDFEDPNVGDGICDVTTSTGETCTLRAAIQESNAAFGGDTINFNIPEAFRDPSSGVATISPNAELPAITDKVIIDGYSQPGSVPNSLSKGTNAVLKIELNGANCGCLAGPADGLKITFDGSDSTVKGLVINRFSNLGVRIAGANVRIEGNFIGTDPSGTVDPTRSSPATASGCSAAYNARVEPVANGASNGRKIGGVA